MKTMIRGVTVFALASAAIAFVPSPRVEPLAPGALRGDIDIVSYGVALVAADNGPALPVLHVRGTFVNRADTQWTVELADMAVSYGDAYPAMNPVLVNTDATTLPIAVINRGERRVIDVYFPTPPRITDSETLSMFALTYRVNTPDRRYQAHAMFGPSKRWPRPEERAPEPGWARRWWANPSYSWATYRKAPGRLVPKPPHKVEIVRVPRSLYEELPSAPSDDDSPRLTECDEW
jgi:hypothetical protein